MQRSESDASKQYINICGFEKKNDREVKNLPDRDTPEASATGMGFLTLLSPFSLIRVYAFFSPSPMTPRVFRLIFVVFQNLS